VKLPRDRAGCQAVDTASMRLLAISARWAVIALGVFTCTEAGSLFVSSGAAQTNELSEPGTKIIQPREEDRYSIQLTQRAVGPNGTQAQSNSRQSRPENNDDLTALYRRAVELKRNSNYGDALRVADELESRIASRLGTNNASYALALSLKGELLLSQGRLGEAESLNRRSLAIREKVSGPDDRAVADSLYGLASVYLRQARYEEAAALYKRALAIWEKTLGPTHSRVGMVLENLASIDLFQGRYANAEALYKRAIAIAEKNLGTDHLDVAKSRDNLALLYFKQGRYRESEELYRFNLAIEEKFLGPLHPGLAPALSNLALVFDQQGRYREAEELFKRVQNWPAPGSEDTELGVLMELEVGHGETEVYPRVQA
jgi:tetratricopeptide (TPR) repeat protein